MNPLRICNLKDKPEYLQPLAVWHQGQWSYLNPGETLQGRIKRMQPYLNADFIPSTWCAEWNGKLAGSAALIQSDMDTHPELTPWLASVFVHPVYRRQGIASALVRHVLAQAATQNIAVMYLFTPDQQGLYEKLGWQSLAQEEYRGSQVSIMKYPIQLST